MLHYWLHFINPFNLFKPKHFLLSDQITAWAKTKGLIVYYVPCTQLGTLKRYDTLVVAQEDAKVSIRFSKNNSGRVMLEFSKGKEKYSVITNESFTPIKEFIRTSFQLD